MNDPVEQPEEGKRASDVRFADAAARAELAGYLDVLRDPRAHEGRRTERIKANPSRTVWRCRLGDGDYYLKHYHSRDLSHRLGAWFRGDDGRRELELSRYLLAEGVAATEVLAAGRLGGRSWMISRTVADATPADTWHDGRADSPDRRRIRQVLQALAVLVARMHDAGVIHHDLHAGNILLRPTDGRLEPVLTDLHRAGRRRRLGRRAAAKNLAELAHDRRHATTRTQRLRFLKHYLRIRGAAGTLRGWAVFVEHFAATHEHRLYSARDRRVVGRNRYFTRLRLGRGWRGHVIGASKQKPPISAAARMEFDADAWRSALAEPERLLEGPAVPVLKVSKSTRVVRRTLTVGVNAIDVYIKRRRRKKWHKALIDLFRRGRAVRAFRLGHALITRRFPTALPLAALERRTARLLHESILITEAVDASVSLDKLWDSAGPPAAIRPRDLAAPLGRLLRSLHDGGFVHRDLKASNLLVRSAPDGSVAIILIDLDGLRRRRWVSQRNRYQGLARLNAAMAQCPAVTRTDRLRMLLGYLRRPGSGRIEFKHHWEELNRRTQWKLAAGREKD